jgi:endonuclease YncB( thermonuclease family)
MYKNPGYGPDRGGNFIDRLTTTDGQSAALMLVQAGIAKAHASAYNAPNYPISSSSPSRYFRVRASA